MIKSCNNLLCYTDFIKEVLTGGDVAGFMTENTDKSIVMAKRLDYMMQILGLTNVQTARFLTVDSSLLSRIRHGKRFIYEETPLFDSLCHYLAKQLIKKSKQLSDEDWAQLAPVRLSTEDEDKDVELYARGIADWLSADAEKARQEDASASITQLLTSIDIWEGPGAVPRNVVQPLIHVPLSPAKRNYVGNQGLREAVLRFLTDVLASKEHRHLQLFSNQSMGWLQEDSNFFLHWSRLMYLIISRGHQVDIVHNLGRSPEEIILGMQSWFPLHMTGNLKAYVNEYLNNQAMPFVHTTFLDKGHAAIHGVTIKGQEDSVNFSYYTGAGSLSSLEQNFAVFLNYCTPLLTPNQAEQFPHLLEDWYDYFLQENGDTDFMIWTSSIPCVIWKETDFMRLMQAARLSSPLQDKYLNRFRQMKQLLHSSFRQGALTMIFPEPEANQCSVQMDYFGKEHIRIPLSTSQCQQLKAYLRKGQEGGLSWRMVGKFAAKNLQIFLAHKKKALIVKTGEPFVALESSYASFIYWLEQYLRSL